jgi:glucose/arabinose dehydrogenase
VFNGEKIQSQERLLKGEFGRIRDVVEGPDGSIYFCTSNRDPYGESSEQDDRVMRIVPVK